MTQDNIQVDTPQESSNEETYTSLEEAVFGNTEGSNDVSSAFTSGNEGNTETAPVETGQPEVSNNVEENQPVQSNNDETRFQYWQSQADKYKNELESIKQQQVPVQQQQIAEPEPTVEEFPAAPDRPQQPRTFNREEAYADPNSESARYLNELESWRDDMNEYNSLKSQYQTALIEDKFNKMENDRIEAAKRQEAAQMQAEQTANIKSHVMGHHGMNENEANDFMTRMSDPNSINIDNLVQLYRMQQGGAAPQNNAPAEPSASFQQTKNAQQVPSPMGVMPSGQSNADSRTMEDKIMDNLIGNFNSKNPWK
tara:strand:+ start:1751 stop:2683 length:933 start_codon:yes stop_codon:yes gene_type:complete